MISAIQVKDWSRSLKVWAVSGFDNVQWRTFSPRIGSLALPMWQNGVKNGHLANYHAIPKKDPGH